MKVKKRNWGRDYIPGPGSLKHGRMVTCDMRWFQRRFLLLRLVENARTGLMVYILKKELIIGFASLNPQKKGLLSSLSGHNARELLSQRDSHDAFSRYLSLSQDENMDAS